jgi:hypothetical protein
MKTPPKRTSRARRTLVTEPLEDSRPALITVLQARQADLEKMARAAAPAPSFTVWQSTLVSRLGITREEFRAVRLAVLVWGVDWGFDATNHVALTAAAAEKIAAHLGLAAGALAAAADVPLRVTKAGPQIRNHRLLAATLGAPCGLLAAGAPVLVFVRDNTRWRVGDAITARHREGQYFDLSSRTPRRRG